MTYLLFLGRDYYPSGGADDWEACFDSVEEAKAYALGFKNHWEWGQIAVLDGKQLREVCFGSRKRKQGSGEITVVWRDSV